MKKNVYTLAFLLLCSTIASAQAPKTFTYDHVMLIFGKAVDEQGKPYYLVKNSWGTNSPYKGIWYMSRDYIALNTTYLFLNRNALSENGLPVERLPLFLGDPVTD